MNSTVHQSGNKAISTVNEDKQNRVEEYSLVVVAVIS